MEHPRDRAKRLALNKPHIYYGVNSTKWLISITGMKNIDENFIATCRVIYEWNNPGLKAPEHWR